MWSTGCSQRRDFKPNRLGSTPMKKAWANPLASALYCTKLLLVKSNLIINEKTLDYVLGHCSELQQYSTSELYVGNASWRVAPRMFRRPGSSSFPARDAPVTRAIIALTPLWARLSVFCGQLVGDASCAAIQRRFWFAYVTSYDECKLWWGESKAG
jgi:hypothetical protein